MASQAQGEPRQPRRVPRGPQPRAVSEQASVCPAETGSAGSRFPELQGVRQRGPERAHRPAAPELRGPRRGRSRLGAPFALWLCTLGRRGSDRPPPRGSRNLLAMHPLGGDGHSRGSRQDPKP